MAELRPQVLQARQQRQKEGRPVLQRLADQVDDGVLRGIFEQPDHLVHDGRLLVRAQGHRVFEGFVIAFGIDDAELIALLVQPLEDAGGHGRFPAPRGAGDQQVDAMGRDPDLAARFAAADEDMVARQPVGARFQIVAHQLVDELDDAPAVLAGGDEIGALLQRRERVGDRHGAFAEAQKSVVVLRVADADDVVSRHLQLAEREGEAAGLVDPGGEDHHRSLVEDDLHLEAEVPNDVEHGVLVRARSRDDDVADGERGDSLVAERPDELFRRRAAVDLFPPAGRMIDQGPVLGDDPLEKIRPGENCEQVFELSPGHQDQFAAGGQEPLQGVDRLRGHASPARQRLVEIAGQDQISHVAPPPIPLKNIGTPGSRCN